MLALSLVNSSRSRSSSARPHSGSPERGCRSSALSGVVDGLAFLVAAGTVATTRHGIGALAFRAFILWAVWLIATSVVMFRAPDAVPEGA